VYVKCVHHTRSPLPYCTLVPLYPSWIVPQRTNLYTCTGLPGLIRPGIRGYERLAGAIDWLEAAGLILRVPIANSGQLPFPAYEKENFSSPAG